MSSIRVIETAHNHGLLNATGLGGGLPHDPAFVFLPVAFMATIGALLLVFSRPRKEHLDGRPDDLWDEARTLRGSLLESQKEQRAWSADESPAIGVRAEMELWDQYEHDKRDFAEGMGSSWHLNSIEIHDQLSAQGAFEEKEPDWGTSEPVHKVRANNFDPSVREDGTDRLPRLESSLPDPPSGHVCYWLWPDVLQ